jgi:hypothetical protein
MGVVADLAKQSLSEQPRGSVSTIPKRFAAGTVPQPVSCASGTIELDPESTSFEGDRTTVDARLAGAAVGGCIVCVRCAVLSSARPESQPATPPYVCAACLDNR